MRKIKIIAEIGKIEKTENGGIVVVPISSKYYWLSATGAAVIDTAGRVFHNQIPAEKLLKDGKTLIANGKSFAPKDKFQDVLFVVNDRQLPLSKIIDIALRIADKNGHKKVVIPMELAGINLTVDEMTQTEKTALENMALGVKNFIAESPNPLSIEEIVFMSPDNTASIKYLRSALKNQGCIA